MSRYSEYEFLVGSSNRCNKRLHSVEEVAAFICRDGLIGDVTVRTPDGEPVLDTFGIYLNKVSDMEYREELLKVLVPMQEKVCTEQFSDEENDTEDEEDAEL